MDLRRWLVTGLAGLLSGPVLACPLTDQLAQRYGISFSGFAQAIPKAAAPGKDDGTSFVRVVFPDASNVADGFRHTAVLNKSTGKAWILRTGGFAGVYQWYGPVDAGKVSLANCRLEPSMFEPSTRAADEKRGRTVPLDWSLARAQTGGGT